MQGLQADEIIAHHLGDQVWEEIVPLAAVLARRNTPSRIVELVSNELVSAASRDRGESLAGVLTQCLVDGAHVQPAILDSAYRALSASAWWGTDEQVDAMLASDRAPRFRVVVETMLRAGGEAFDQVASVFAAIVRRDGVDAPMATSWDEEPDVVHLVRPVVVGWSALDRGAALQAIGLPSLDVSESLNLVESDSTFRRLIGCWGLAVAAATTAPSSQVVASLIPTLAAIWLDDSSAVVRTAAARALSALPAIEPSAVQLADDPRLTKAALSRRMAAVAQPGSLPARQGAALVLGYYRGYFDRWEVVDMARRFATGRGDSWLDQLRRQFS